jgi:16S rRNA processing protein RimM
MTQVAVGRFGSPHGVLGELKVISFTNPTENILNYLPWFIFKQGQKVVIETIHGRKHGQNLVVRLDQSNNRDIAKTYTNLEIYIDRAQLPPPSEDEFYWIDLMGLKVLNKNQQALGVVDNILATGANEVLVVKGLDGRDHYIPYIDGVIIKVDLNDQVLLVDWDITF